MNRDPSRKAVRAAYERIAPHFAETRHHPWPEVLDFLETVDGRLGLDIGCGNGRHLPPLSEAVDTAIGIDLSRNVLREVSPAIARDSALVEGEATCLPVREAIVDVVLCVATVHHLPSRANRVRALDELARVLRPGGCALVSVWSVTAGRFDFDRGRDEWLTWTLPDGEEVERFYHIYDREAFERELIASRLELKGLEESSGNWYARVTVS